MMTISIPIEDYVVPDAEPMKISDETIDLSKSLARLEKLK